MWYIGHIANAKTGFPVAAVDEGAPETWVVAVLSGPRLNRHVVNVNPSAHGGFPSNFVLADLDDGVAQTGGRNAREVSSGRADKVEMRNGHAPARFADGIVAVVVVRVGHEHVPFAVDHVGVEVVRSRWVVGIVPRVDPRWVRLVGDVDEGDQT